MNNQRRDIRCEFESIDPTMLKKPRGVGRGLLPTLQWVASWLLTYRASFPVK